MQDFVRWRFAALPGFMALTPEQEDAVAQFVAISGCLEDEDRVVLLLQVNAWDLNNALVSYFDRGFGMVDRMSLQASSADSDVALSASGPELLEDPDAAHLSRRRRLSANELVNLQNQMFMESFRPRLPKAPRISNHWQLEVGIHSSLADSAPVIERRPAVSSWWLILLLVPRTLLLLLMLVFRFLFAGSGKNYIGRLPAQFDYSRFSPDFDFQRSLCNKEDDSAPDLSVLNVQSSDFNLVFQSAQTGYSWLLIVLVDGRSDSERFLQHFFSSPEITQLLNKRSGTFKENAIFVNNVQESPEAHEVGKSYKTKRLPFVCLVANVSNDASVMASMLTLYKSNIAPEFLEPELVAATVKKLSENLQNLMEQYDPQLVSQRFDRQEIEFARLLKQQQDDAYTQSLEKDRVKKLEREHQQRLQESEQERAQQKRRFLAKLAGENWFQNLCGGAGGLKLAIRLPNGSRIVESVPESVSLQQLYLHVEVQLFLQNEPSGAATDTAEDTSSHGPPGAASAPEILFQDYFSYHPFTFDLMQPYPRKVLDAGPETLGSVAELRAGANLLVEYRDDPASTVVTTPP